MSKKGLKQKLIVLAMVFIILIGGIAPTPAYAAGYIKQLVPLLGQTSEPSLLDQLGSLFSSEEDSGQQEAADEGILDRIQSFFGFDENQDKLNHDTSLTLGRSEKIKVASREKTPIPKRKKEINEERTAHSKMFELTDGRKQAEISNEPIHYQDKQGNWQEISTDIQKSNKSGYQFANQTNTYQSYFGERTDQLVQFQLGDRSLSFGLVDEKNKKLPLQKKENKVTYLNVFENANLTYDVNIDSLKESIVLQKAPDNPEYRFSLKMKGLEAKERKDGSIAFFREGEEGGPLFVMPKPFMMDDQDDKDSPYGKRWSGAVSQSLKKVGEEYQIIIKADKNWLQQKERKYPVIIDPTIQLSASSEEAQDAMVISGSNANANFGDSWKLSVGTTSNAITRSLFKFQLPDNLVGKKIDSAHLNVYYDQTFTANKNDVEIEARRLNQDWDEQTVTWNSAKLGQSWTQSGGDFGQVEFNQEEVDNSDVGKVEYDSSKWPASGNSQLKAVARKNNYQYNNDSSAGDTFTWVPTITEDGNYLVEMHYTTASDRSDQVPYTIHHANGKQEGTVDQTKGSLHDWTTLSSALPFQAGTTQKIVMSDVPDDAVIADAVRFTKYAKDTREAGKHNTWHSFSVRSAVQDWLDYENTNGTTGAPNYGLVLKASDESTLGQGGPRYEANESVYNGETENHPKLIITYGNPGVNLDAPDTLHATGAELTWSSYEDLDPNKSDDDLLEYQVHRGQKANFIPNASTLLSSVGKEHTTYKDISADPETSYYYVIVAKTTEEELVSQYRLVTLPKRGQTQKIIQEKTVDTTLASNRPNESHDRLTSDGISIDETWIEVGNNSSYYGDARTLLAFNTSTIPKDARIEDATLSLWGVDAVGSGAVYDLHALTRSFDEASGTWNHANQNEIWSSPGGAYDLTILSSISTVSSDPKWYSWKADSIVQTWIDNPSSNYGFLIKSHDETVAQQRVLFLSSEGEENRLRPKLVVTYTEQSAAKTYHAPNTPNPMNENEIYKTTMVLTNTTTETWKADSDYLSYQWVSSEDKVLTDVESIQTRFNPLDVEGNPTENLTDLAPGESITVQAQVKSPSLSHSNLIKEEYTLKWDVVHSGKRLSESNVIPALEQKITIEKAENENGTNVGNVDIKKGNVNLTYQPAKVPSGGMVAFAQFSYNSLSESPSVLGPNWELAAATYMRLGIPAGDDTPTEVKLLGNKGQSYEFKYDANSQKFEAPKGKKLHLQFNDSPDNLRRWVVTDSDRTQYYFDKSGYLTEVIGKSGLKLYYVYEEREINHVPTKLIKYVGRSQFDRLVEFEYNDHNQLTTVTDIAGKVTKLSYDEQGRLIQFIDGDGDPNAKTYQFQYLSEQSNQIIKVTDPLGHDKIFDYTASGDDALKVEKVTNRSNETLSYTYQDDLVIITDPMGRQTKYKYNDLGKPLSITNAKDETIRFTYDANGNVTSRVEENGATTTWAYDQYGFPKSVTDPINNAISDVTKRKSTRFEYQYSLDGHIADLIKATTPEGHSKTYQYDEQGRKLSETDALGNQTKFTYHDGLNLVKTITDPKGNVTKLFSYHESGKVSGIANALGQVTQFSYGDRGELLGIVDANEKKSTFTYDIFNRPLTSKTPKDVASDEYIEIPAPVYDKNDNVIELTAANGAKTTFTYDANNRLIERIEPQIDDSLGTKKKTFQYDEIGNLIKETMPKGNLTPSDPNDYAISYQYDELNRLIEVTNSEGHRITTAYDEVGNPISVTQPKGNVTEDNPNDYTVRTSYDLNHRPNKVTDVTGKSIEKTYDSDGNMTSITDKEGNTTTYTYNAIGLLMEESVPHNDQVNRITKYKYDAVQNLVEIESPRGSATAQTGDFVEKMVYDELNRIKERIFPRDPASGNTRFQTEHKFTYEYDILGNLTKVSAPPSEGQTDRNETVFTYYDNGLLKGIQDPWEITTQYQYNDLGLQTKRIVSSSDGSQERTMSWNYYDDGKLKSMTDFGLNTGENQKKQFEYQYDLHDNLIQMIDHSTDAQIDRYETEYTSLEQVSQIKEILGGNEVRTISYQYDEHGNVEKQTYDGGINAYTYNALDQVEKAIHMATSNDANPQVSEYRYTPNGAIALEKLPNGNRTQYQYNADASLKQLQTEQADGTILQKHVLEYNPNGHRTKDTFTGLDSDEKPIQNVFTYQFDPRDRLVEATKTGSTTWTEKYVLDPNGNIVEKVQNDEKTQYQYDKNRLTSLTKAGETSSYQYDLMGQFKEVTASGHVQEEIKYDPFGRPVRYAKTDDKNVTNTTTYQYDSLDRTRAQISQVGTADETKTTYNYLSMTDQLITEEVSGQIVNSYTYSPWGQRLSMLKKDQNEISYYQYNVHGDVEALTDANGQIRGTYGYTPYGEMDPDAVSGVDKSGEDVYNRYRYGGMPWDSNTENYDLGFRNYSPSLGRFTSPDSYNNASAHAGLSLETINNNLYAFTGGNPVSYMDWNGHDPTGDDGDDGTGIGIHDDEDCPVWYPGLPNEYPCITVLPSDLPAFCDEQPNLCMPSAELAGYYPGGADVDGSWVTGTDPGYGIGYLGTGHGGQYTGYGWSEGGHLLLDGLGFANPLADGVNAIWYGLEGDYKNAGISALGVVPFLGDAAVAGRIGSRAYDASKACQCFTAGTTVLTEEGEKPIEEVKIGDKVLAKDENTGEVAYKEVEWLYQRDVTEIYQIHVEDEVIETTAEHPFWGKGVGWVKTQDLKSGDVFETADGRTLNVDKVVKRDKKTTVYNFKVKDFHTYYVSNLKVFTHNKCDIELFRGVSPEEFYDIMDTKSFNIIENAYNGKQFAKNFDELKKLVDSPIFSDTSAIVKVKVPKDVYNKLDHTQVDSHVLKSGSVTVGPSMIDEFNKAVKDTIEHIF
ncbi:DNRLRE domain-containing protein [Hazenella sp. IB182357]|uniref:DNRLRE domain-containing protein n=1 Tax=Polycladospora coralii TaxID=2771432 RepID=A0A926NEW3_9BACL|nr:DNRLRE domain-containing protein [Polycladospora coralii]MBD1372153.1 DNRLRE domain-containing protein [Polycladospora coralii]